jgi:hypothetical protein
MSFFRRIFVGKLKGFQVDYSISEVASLEHVSQRKPESKD